MLNSDHESLANFNDQAVLKGRDWRYAEQISGYVFEQRYRKGDMIGIPDALSRALASLRITKYLTGDTEVWHDVLLVHGTEEVISITTPKKKSLPLNEDVISVNAIISDLWTKIVGIYTLTALASITGGKLRGRSEENILRDGVTD